MVILNPVRLCALYPSFDYLKSHNKFYQDISVSKGLSSNEMLIRCYEVELVEAKKIDKLSEIIIQNEPLFTLIENPLVQTELFQIKQLYIYKFQLSLIQKMLLQHQGKEKHQYHCYMILIVKNQHFWTSSKMANFNKVFLEIYQRAQADTLIKRY